MDFGFALPPRGPVAAPENIATLAHHLTHPSRDARAPARVIYI
jgi:hypothetical protein